MDASQISLSGEPALTSDMAQVRVSIVTPCLNGRQYLPQMVESVLQQKHPNWELIFVDDGSTDGSVEYMREHQARDPRIVVRSTSGRRGSAHARNVGITEATGSFVAFLDCDDWWTAEKLDVQLREMTRAGASFSCTAYTVCDQAGSAVRPQPVCGPLTSQRHLHKAIVVGCLTVMFNRASFPGVRFDETIRKAEDYCLWFKMLAFAEKSGLRAIAVSTPLAFYRAHPGGKSANKMRRLVTHWNLYRRVFHFSFGRSLWCLVTYIFHGLRDRVPRYSELRRTFPFRLWVPK